MSPKTSIHAYCEVNPLFCSEIGVQVADFLFDSACVQEIARAMAPHLLLSGMPPQQPQEDGEQRLEVSIAVLVVRLLAAVSSVWQNYDME